jgi:hypothetical protein
MTEKMFLSSISMVLLFLCQGTEEMKPREKVKWTPWKW